ncbi:MAG: hypothetical protein PUP91_26115 [Rhizonema sp. PD37]|nr:hypothetical protein [Rhizonema sp. PD37]
MYFTNICVRHDRLSTSVVVAVAVSLGISVIGAGLLVAGKASEGSVTTATGLISTTLCSQIAKESGEKLEELREDLRALGSSSNT